MTQLENTYSLLALCARAQSHPTQSQYLRQQSLALDNSDWDTLPSRAKSHGLTPLLYTHLQTAGVSAPAAVQQQLQARTIQHRRHPAHPHPFDAYFEASRHRSRHPQKQTW